MHAAAEVRTDARQGEKVFRRDSRSLARDDNLRSRWRGEVQGFSRRKSLDRANKHPTAVLLASRIDEFSEDVTKGSIAGEQSTRHGDAGCRQQKVSSRGIVR